MLKEFLKKEGILFREKVNTNKLITIKTIQNLNLLVELKNVKELIKVSKYLHSNAVFFRVIGGGSNLLITDKCENVPVLRLSGEFNSFLRNSEESYRVFAGTSLMNFCRKLINEGLSGLEFAAGIPATFGGAIWMNAGAHGSEIASVIENVYCIDKEGSELKLSISQLNPTYRSMNLSSDLLVYGCDINLTKSNKEVIREKMQELLAYRKKTQPLSLPSCGSVFKNITDGDTVRYAGEVIESLGLKGKSVGGAEFSTLHANWIVNPKKEAIPKDVLSLINMGMEKAKKEYGLNLVPEVQVW